MYSVSMPMQADCADIHVACIECDAIGPSVLFDQTSHSDSDIPDLEAEAVAAWSRRDVRSQPSKAFQMRVQPWMMECFGAKISADKLERGDRALEEMFELLQSGDYPRERVAALRDYVWDRPKGDPLQEAGGVMVTLAAYCLAFGLDMHEAGEVELARITQPEIVQKIRAKQAAKPTGSALPVAQSKNAGGLDMLKAALEEARRTLTTTQPSIICTVWCATSPAETLLDHIDAAFTTTERAEP